MKQVICINPKEYKLTESKKYNVIKEVRGFYVISNDSDIPLLYSSKLFKDVPNASEIQNEIIENGNIIVNADGYQYNTVINNENYNFYITLEDKRILASCGIRNISGINNIKYKTEEFLNNNNIEFNNDFIKLLINDILKKLIDKNNCSLLLFSTNTNHEYNEDNNEDFDFLDDILSELSDSTYTEFNPNSCNYIKLWVIKKDNSDHEDYFEL